MPAEQSKVLTLVFTDLANSTALKRERGDVPVGELIARHREQVTRLAEECAGRIIDWAGDGCFLAFETPSAAVQFSLLLQQKHAEVSDLPSVRVGLHMGEVTEKVGPDNTTRVEGLAVDLAARISGLAQAGQVLMSSSVFNSARQRLNSDDVGAPIAWRAHGLYELKGFDDAMDIAEAGVEGISPLAPPPGSEKAHRAVTPAEEETLGWRPAVGLTIPKRDNWTLTAQLGEGGYGEVWLAAHDKTKAKRVFKFCFEPERVRGLKREVVLFRLLKESLGDREDIAQILDWEFEHPPFFLESEYTEGGDLKEWAQNQGGLATVPIETRIEIAAQAAVALGAAHGAGVLHKDIKPTNILITETKSKAGVQASLTDFGIGLVTDPSALLEKGITAAGLTQTLVSGGSSSGSGTRMYMAPEVIEGKPATTRSDLYALGVVLYQLVTGDLSRTIAPGWERDIEDDVLREDIQACVEGRVEMRLSSADELAGRLRKLDERRLRRAKELRAKRRRRVLTVASIVGPILTVAVLGVAWQQNRLAVEARKQKDIAVQERIRNEVLTYQSQLGRVEDLIERNETALASELLNDTSTSLRNWEWGYLAAQSRSRLNFTLPQPQGTTYSAAAFSNHGTHVVAGSWDGSAVVIRLKDMKEIVRVKGANDWVAQVGFLPGGQRFFTAVPKDGVRVWELETGRLVYHLPNPKAPLHFAAFYPDGTRVVTASAGDSPRVWDTETGEFLFALPGGIGNGRRNRLTLDHDIFSPDGRRVVTHPDWYDPNDRIQSYVVNANTGETILAIPDFDAWLTQFTPDGTRILATHDSVSHIYDAQTGDLLLELDDTAMYFDPESKYVMTFSARDTKVRDIESGRIIRTMVRPNFQLIISSDFSTYAAPDPATGQFTTFGILGQEQGASFNDQIIELSKDGSRALTWRPLRSDDPSFAASVVDTQNLRPGVLSLVDTQSGKQLVAEDAGASTFNRDGSRLFLARLDGTGTVYETGDGTLVREIESLGKGITGARLSRDGSRLLTVDSNRTICMWDVNRGERVSEIEGHRGFLEDIAISEEGGVIRASYPDGTTMIWDIDSGEERFALDGGGTRTDNVSHDGTRIVTVDVGFTSKVWDTRTGEIVHELCCIEGGHAAAFSPDDSLIVTSAYDSARVWNADTGEELYSLRGIENINRMSYFSPDGNLILVWEHPRNIARVYDARTGAEKYTFEAFESKTFSPPAFSPDSSRIVSVTSLGHEYTVRGAESGAVLYAVRLSDPIDKFSFNAAGDELITVTERGDVQIWSTENEDDGELRARLTAEAADGAATRDEYGRVLSPDGLRAIEHSGDGTAQIIDAETGIPLLGLDTKGADLRYSRDGRTLYVVENGHVTRVWKTAPW